MKKRTVYLNREPVTGPWGGGNKFVKSLVEELKTSGHNVVFDLNPGVDVIFCFDPRPNSKGVWYQDMLDHKLKYNSKILQRVGDVGSHSKPELTNLVKQCVNFSDFLIFPSLWSKDYIQYTGNNCSVIHNAPIKIFANSRKEKTDSSLKNVKIVTHHWSTNIKKGFDIYTQLGESISNKSFNAEFTYIGRWNDDFSNAGINLIKPIDAEDLSKLLPTYDVYLTASVEEAGANHVLEAIAVGLPIVYRKGGGSINEYCKEYGEEYDGTLKDMSRALNKVKSEYNIYQSNMTKYKKTIKDVVSEYVRLVCQI